ncbi:MAG: cobalamin-dependent protein [Candidatus Omnitrophota bacterium]
MRKKVDLLLVIPRQANTAKFLSLSSGITHPLGAGYVANYLIKHGFNVEILDNVIEQLNRQEFSNYIGKIQPSCVGFSTFTTSINNAFNFASAIKEVNKSTKVIMGGMHASALPEDVLRHEEVDIVVKGEGEETTLELLRVLENGGNLRNIKGIVYKDSGQIINNPDRELIKGIDSLPLPAYELLPMEKYYLPASRRMGTGRAGSIITGRGCPYQCTFCSRSIFGKKIRLRSPESVVKEIKHLVINYKIKEFLIWDDVFTIDQKRAIEICRLIRKNKLNIIWSCSSRVDCISDKLFQELSLAGCREILLGAESGSQIILDSFRKDTTLAQIEESVRLCKKHNMLAFCTFVLGSSAETKETLAETLRFVKKIDPHYAIFCLLAPLPGSQLFNEAVASGKINLIDTNWDDYISILSSVPPPIQISGLDRKELIKWQKKSFREFYLRPKYILRHLCNLKSLNHIFESWRGFRALMGHQLHVFDFHK